MSKRPDAAKKRLVGVPLKIQSAQVFKRVCGGIAVDLTILLVTAQSLSDLNIRKMRYVQANGWVGNPRRNDSS